MNELRIRLIRPELSRALHRLAAIALMPAAAIAAPLTETTAVQLQPDASAPAITILKAGSEPVAARAAMADTPAGWMAVSVPGPFTGYVQNRDLTKSLDVRPGASIYLAPKTDSGVMATANAGDKIELTGLHGRWTQVRLEKELVGYIHLGPLPSTSPPPARAVPPPAAPPPADLGTTASAGKPAPRPDSQAGELPRFFEGRFVASPRSLFAPRRPYPWQLDDASGSRAVYLDISHLMLTDQIANYPGHDVQVFGTVKPVPGTQDIVIEVESLTLK